MTILVCSSALSPHHMIKGNFNFHCNLCSEKAYFPFFSCGGNLVIEHSGFLLVSIYDSLVIVLSSFIGFFN